MISKKIPCDDISASVWYVLFNRGGAKLILGSYGMEFCPTPHTHPEAIQFLTAKLTQHDQLRPEVLSKWRHWSLSAEPDAGLSDANWGQIAFDFLDHHQINLDKNQVMAVLHHDQSVDHLHILWSRIGVDGSLARDVFRDCGISQKACRKIEKKYGLQELLSSVPETKVGRSPPEQKPKKSRKAAEVRMNDRGGKSVAQQFREQVGSVWPRAGEILYWVDFVERLRSSGIEVETNRRGDTVGLAYRWNGHYRKASDLGDEYK